MGRRRRGSAGRSQRAPDAAVSMAQSTSEFNVPLQIHVDHALAHFPTRRKVPCDTASDGPRERPRKPESPRPKEWGAILSGFLEEDYFAAWWKGMMGREPVYVVRPDLVDELSRPFGEGKEVVFDKQGREAEHAFHDVCRKFSPSVIGVWNGRPIRSPLEPGPSLANVHLDADDLHGWSEKHKSQFCGMATAWDEESKRTLRNLRRQAGRLVSSKEYVADVMALRRRATELGLDLVFPLHRRTWAAIGRRVTKRKLAEFGEDVVPFLDRWELSELTTWDIPVPVGPIGGMTNEQSGWFRGKHAKVENAYPGYYDIPRADVHEAVGRLSSPGHVLGPLGRPLEDGRVNTYERVYELWFQELAVRQRFRSCKPPRGWVTALVAAFAAVSKPKGDRIRQLREKYMPALGSLLRP